MTYKHIGFDDSATMRSLLKIAHQKGLIKEEAVAPLVKEASSVVFSESLTENIISLCGGLRAQGFDKYADEIEEKFLALKTAEAKYYDVSGEKGEDLVDCAHPDGSHKVEDASDEHGVVETILDQHKKIVEITEKTPKGKFANQKIIEMVKNALSDDAIIKTAVTWKDVGTVFAALLGIATLPFMAPVGAIAGIALWTKTRKIAMGITSNTQKTIDEIDDLLSKDVALNLRNQLNSTKAVLSEILLKFPKLSATPDEAGAKEIISFKSFIDQTVQPQLSKTLTALSYARDKDEKGVLPTTIRLFLASNYEDVENAIAGLRKAITEHDNLLNDVVAKTQEYKKDEEMAKKENPAGSSTSSSDNTSVSTPSVASPAKSLDVGAQNELNNLDSWEKEINDFLHKKLISVEDAGSNQNWINKMRTALNKPGANLTKAKELMADFYNTRVLPHKNK